MNKLVLAASTLLLFHSLKAQKELSFGVFTGVGLNIYDNQYKTDFHHFEFNARPSMFIGVRVLKNLDEKHNLYSDLTYSRKKIELEYNLNEPDVPFENREYKGQKYESLSFHVGYRRQFNLYTSIPYVEGSIGGDYNSNNVLFDRGNGSSSSNALEEDVMWQTRYNSNLGEKGTTISANIGAGINFGERNEFDLGFQLNIPFQKIQTKPSTYEAVWTYKRTDYRHSADFFGKIYYPAIKLTYYF